MKYSLFVSFKRENNAGTKAVSDALRISEKLGYMAYSLYDESVGSKIFNIFKGWLSLRLLKKKLKPNDIVFIQYPTNRFLIQYALRIIKKKKATSIVLIHDINFLRNAPLKFKSLKATERIELSLIDAFDYVISHNTKMTRKLMECGVETRIFNLEIFDYLYSGSNATIDNNNSVIVAGNLFKKKAGYLYSQFSHDFIFNLYGSNLEFDLCDKHAKYCGSFKPDEMIENLKGRFGLVWDGDEIDGCSGDYSNYLRFNNPHKTSLYLAAWLPVIVWKESALCEFVEKNGVGFGVNSLNEVDEVIKKCDYDSMLNNITRIKRNLRDGFYLTEVLKKIEEQNEAQ